MYGSFNRVVLLVAAVSSLSFSANAQESREDLIEFLNGDRFHGTIHEIREDGHLIVNSEAADGTIPFKTSKLSRVNLISREGTTITAGKDALVNLSNGDAISGTIVSMKEDVLILNTPAVGKINIETAMITSIDPRAGFSGHYYTGPTNDDKWLQPDGQQDNRWRIENGKMSAPAQVWIGRNLDIPKDAERINFEFNLEWTLRPSINFYFMMPTVDMYRNNCYQLTIQSSYIRLYRRENSISRSVGYVQHIFRNTRNAKIQILVDKANQSFVLVIDGRPVQTWRDPSPAFAGTGTGIQFLNNQSSPVTISNLRIMEWQGPAGASLDSKKETDGKDLLTLVNGDSVQGSVTSISSDSISFKTEFDTLPIPLKRISRAKFARDTRARARRYKGDTEILLAGEGRITLRVKSLANNTLSGYSENFGDVELPLSNIREIRFNLYRDLQLLGTP